MVVEGGGEGQVTGVCYVGWLGAMVVADLAARLKHAQRRHRSPSTILAGQQHIIPGLLATFLEQDATIGCFVGIGQSRWLKSSYFSSFNLHKV